MQGHYCETAREPVGLDKTLRDSLGRMNRLIMETDAELRSITSCPAPCLDRTVEITPPSSKPRRVKCPIMNSGCSYGAKISEMLDAYVLDIMGRIGVPPRHTENFGKFRDSCAVSAAMSWQLRGFLLLSGISGIGKSFAAARVVWKYLKGQTSDWPDKSSWSAISVAGEKVAWNSAKEITDDKAIASRARKAALLVIDDLGKEAETPASMSAIRDVMSKRYDLELATVITSELAFLDVQKKYGQYIAERLTEDYCSKCIDCRGESFRLKEAEYR
jgi:hypothetical protein